MTLRIDSQEQSNLCIGANLIGLAHITAFSACELSSQNKWPIEQLAIDVITLAAFFFLFKINQLFSLHLPGSR
jgi:hypothetical protein